MQMRLLMPAVRASSFCATHPTAASSSQDSEHEMKDAGILGLRRQHEGWTAHMWLPTDADNQSSAHGKDEAHRGQRCLFLCFLSPSSGTSRPL